MLDSNAIPGLGYKEYRHPKFERFIIATEHILITSSIGFLAIKLWQMTNVYVSFAFLMVYHLLGRMKDHSIYFFDNKGIGPSWTTVFRQDLCYAFSNSFIIISVMYALMSFFTNVCNIKDAQKDHTCETNAQVRVEQVERK